jgi:hypothetical protein
MKVGVQASRDEAGAMQLPESTRTNIYDCKPPERRSVDPLP